MAIRISQSVFEVLIGPDNANTRISQSVLEVLVQSRIIVELPIIIDDALDNWVDSFSILLLSNVIKSDDLDSWSDNIRLHLGLVISDDLDNWNDDVRLHTELIAEDSLNNWTDSFDVDCNVYFGLATVDVADNFIVKSGRPPHYKWTDGIALIRLPSGPLDIAVDDLSTWLGVEVGIDIGLIFGDTLNVWSDTAKPAFGILIERWDSEQWSWKDAITWSYLRGNASTDQLSLSDAVEIDRSTSNIFIDTFIIRDEVKLILSHSTQFSEQLIINDTESTLGEYLKTFSDDIDNLSDALDKFISLKTTQGVTSDLADWNDTIRVLRSGSDLSYLRRYLDDVV